MSTIFSGAFGGDALKAFWYHFAIMFEALFILTTVDAGTRVGRFMLQDTSGNIWKPMARPSWRPGVYLTSAIVVGGWGYFLWVGVTDPLGGINQLFPLFGIANQLLAAVALTVATTILIKSGRVKWAWVTAVPLAWDAAVTLSASWYKIFSSDPLVGFFAQRDKYQQALDAGKVIPPAKSLDDVAQIVTNSTVDGVLSILFAALIIIVIADAARVWWQTLSGRREPVLAEAPGRGVAPVGAVRPVPDGRGPGPPGRAAGRAGRRRPRPLRGVGRRRRRLMAGLRRAWPAPWYAREVMERTPTTTSPTSAATTPASPS